MFIISKGWLESVSVLLKHEPIRWFAKIYGFKQQYPELYKYVHKDSLMLFEKPYVGSKQMVKWMCPNGPDHIWEAELGSKIKSFNKYHKCMFSLRISLTSYLFILSRKTSICYKFSSNTLSRFGKGMVHGEE